MSARDLPGASEPPPSEEEAGAELPVSNQVQLEVDLLKSAVRPASPPVSVRSDPDTAGRALTLLVADDDADLRTYVKRCLRGVDFEIDRILEAEDGEEALALARRIRVDLIISDVVMPGLDGFALCRALREDDTLRHIPVLLITGELSERETRNRIHQAKAQDVLAKPFNRPKLCSRVMQLLSRPPPA